MTDFDQMKTPPSYTTLESCGSWRFNHIARNTDHLTCKPSEFRGRWRTDFLDDLRLCHMFFMVEAFLSMLVMVIMLIVFILMLMMFMMLIVYLLMVMIFITVIIVMIILTIMTLVMIILMTLAAEICDDLKYEMKIN